MMRASVLKTTYGRITVFLADLWYLNVLFYSFTDWFRLKSSLNLKVVSGLPLEVFSKVWYKGLGQKDA